MATWHRRPRTNVTGTHLFRLLKKKGIATIPFVTRLHHISRIGLPAVLWDGNTYHTIARLSDILPTFIHVKSRQDFFIQKYIAGTEVVCGVIKYHGKLVALAPVDVVPRLARESVPPHLSEIAIENARALALRAHRTLGIRGASCVRMVCNDSRQWFVTGVDRAPLSARVSALAQSAAVVGISLDELQQHLKKI